METGYQVELDVFEGPLDLLLHLVKKHELSILEIPISFVTEKYLAYLDAWQELDIDVASEYLLMAATLCHIKSRELLPNPEPLEPEETEEGKVAEEEIDPRADLIKRLLEYQKYREAAEQLGGRPVVGRNVWHRGVPLEDAVGEGIDMDAIAPLLPFPVVKLIEAFDRVMRSAKVAKVSHNVTIDQLSISQKIAELTDRLEAEGRFAFTSMFSFLKEGVVRTLKEIRHEAVVTFLALLEMAKLRLLSLQQLPEDEEIFIERVGDDLRARVAQGVARTDDYRS